MDAEGNTTTMPAPGQNLSEPIVRQRRNSAWTSVFTTHIVSLLVHAGLLILVVTNARSCTENPGGGDGEFREVGIYVKQPADSQTEESVTDTVSEQSAIPQALDTLTPSLELTEMSSDLLDLPQVEQPPVVGLGSASVSVSPASVDKMLKTTGTSVAAQAAAMGLGKTSFFGVQDEGTRFVYVLDCSGSMLSHNAIGVAKAELMASLESLDATQQFQIIFYNIQAREMNQRTGPAELYWASDINRTLARQFIATVQPEGGTVHLPALKKALRFGPEVIFFLTDADTELSSADLNDIKKLNGNRSRIHCVEFGTGADVSAGIPNFLRKLARQNGGTYRYRDVTQFSQR